MDVALRLFIALTGGAIWLAAGFFYNMLCRKNLIFEDETREAYPITSRWLFLVLFIVGAIVSYVTWMLSPNVPEPIITALAVPVICIIASEIKNKKIPLIGIILTGLISVVYWIYTWMAKTIEDVLPLVLSAAITTCIILVSHFAAKLIFKEKAFDLGRSSLIVCFCAFAPIVQCLIFMIVSFLTMLAICAIKKSILQSKYNEKISLFEVPFPFTPVLSVFFLISASIGWF